MSRRAGRGCIGRYCAVCIDDHVALPSRLRTLVAQQVDEGSRTHIGEAGNGLGAERIIGSLNVRRCPGARWVYRAVAGRSLNGCRPEPGDIGW
jgi:hypothetical protein